MIATTHTPGPWETVNQHIRTVGSRLKVATVASPNESEAVDSPTQEQANARLIAKAPEMLNLLDDLVDNADHSWLSDAGKVEQIKATIEGARALLREIEEA